MALILKLFMSRLERGSFYEMISLVTLITVSIASFLLAIVPGPTVTVIVANSLRDGTKAGLLNIAGTVFGASLLVLILAFGLNTIVTFVGVAFFWIKLAGAAYLVWLGINLLRSDGNLDISEQSKEPAIGYFWQGFVVIITNPKALFFFGAFIPQFVEPNGDAFIQTLVLGFVFIIIASLSDCVYAILAGKAGNWLTRSNVRIAEVSSGLCLILGGIWLALARRG